MVGCYKLVKAGDIGRALGKIFAKNGFQEAVHAI
jgi:hypothetical protein